MVRRGTPGNPADAGALVVEEFAYSHAQRAYQAKKVAIGPQNCPKKPKPGEPAPDNTASAARSLSMPAERPTTSCSSACDCRDRARRAARSSGRVLDLTSTLRRTTTRMNMLSSRTVGASREMRCSPGRAARMRDENLGSARF